MESLETVYGAFLAANLEWFVLGTVLFTVVLGYMGAPLIAWTLFAAVALVGFGAPVWLLWAAAVVAIIFNVKPIRQVLVSGIVMKQIAKILPPISETERTALDAGVVWVEGDLFSGKPDFKKLMNEPYPELTPEEKAFINGPVDKFCAMIDDWEIWQKRDLPPEAWDFLKKERFLGMIIPKEYGGLGFSALCHSEVIQKLSSRSIPACISVMVPNSLGPAELLIHYGTEEQRKKYLPRLAVGDENALLRAHGADGGIGRRGAHCKWRSLQR